MLAHWLDAIPRLPTIELESDDGWRLIRSLATLIQRRCAHDVAIAAEIAEFLMDADAVEALFEDARSRPGAELILLRRFHAELLDPGYPVALYSPGLCCRLLRPIRQFIEAQRSPSPSPDTQQAINDITVLSALVRHRGGQPVTSVPLHRRVDAAAPAEAAVDQVFDLLVQVRLPSAPSLTPAAFPTQSRPGFIEQDEEPFALEFPVDAASGQVKATSVKLRVVTPDCDSPETSRTIEVPADRDSAQVFFPLRPKRAGPCHITVEVLRLDHITLGTIPVLVTISGETVERRLQTASLTILIHPTFIDARGSRGFVNEPGGSVEQHYGEEIGVGNVSSSSGVARGRDDNATIDMRRGDYVEGKTTWGTAEGTFSAQPTGEAVGATLRADQIEAALRAKLPPGPHPQLHALAKELAEVIAGEQTPEQASTSLNRPQFAAAFRSLEGAQPIEAGGAKLEFGGDKITVGNIIDSKAVAAGAGAVAQVFEISLDLSSQKPVPLLKRWVGYIVGAIILIGAALIIYQFAIPLVTPPALMNGTTLNVAIAEFTQLQENGTVIASKPAALMAGSVYTMLDKELDQLPSESSGIEVRSPEQTGAIKGATPEERAEAAAELAAKINADLIFYGVLDPTSTILTPEFYLAPKRLDKAREVAGQHVFGAPLLSDEDITQSAAANVALTEKINRRTRALAELILGLSLFSSREYEAAARHFAAAESADTWEQGVELLYLFQGNTAGKLGNYDQATEYYNQALTVAPDYARARLGLAAVQVQLSKGTCEQGSTDIAGLEAALQLYDQARTTPNQPLEADIPVKAKAGMGQIYLCLTQALAGDYSAEARSAFEAVIAEYERSPLDLRSLAAEAYANLGFLSMPFAGQQGPEAEQQYRTAAALYQKAIEVGRDRSLLSVHYRWLGFIHGRLREFEQADAAYRNAIEYASDDATRSAYEAERRQLQQEQTGTTQP